MHYVHANVVNKDFAYNNHIKHAIVRSHFGVAHGLDIFTFTQLERKKNENFENVTQKTRMLYLKKERKFFLLRFI